jgi:PTH1 family peptidyl-tRNA hydrolase
MTDYVVAGLGNPGAEHAGQRHNAGFWCIDELVRRHSISMKSTRLATEGKGTIEGSEVLLIKPRTWMNRSGQAIGPALKRERVPVEQLIVIYDELDLPEGRIRIRQRGGSGGHNGLKSIIAATGSSDFGRVRVGIGRPYHQGVPTWDPEIVMEHVLSNPSAASKQVLREAIERACDAIEAVIRVGWERAMDVYNRTTAP